jgi:diguanylate cyclase (GGDEF)-like protein
MAIPAATAHGAEIDLSVCEREQIHTPGAIQPHGAVIAVLADGLVVTHASANLAAILGRPPEAGFGRTLEEVIGEVACRILLGTGSRDGAALGPTHPIRGPDGGTLYLHAHRAGRHICVDIEPARGDPGQGLPGTMARSVLETFNYAATREELCKLAVRGLKTITGYDRVMAYRFGADGHGEVIAEAREATLEPYLGLRYPAADVPLSARRQYLRQRVGMIADSNYQPVPLLADPAQDERWPLDLTHSALRSVSPVHRQYMRNMGTAASLTIGLAHGADLWGMLVCHHATPRIAGPELLAVADTIGQVVSLLLVPLGEAQIYAQRHQRNAILRALVDRLAAPLPLPEAFAAAEAELLRLVDAAGAVVRLSGSLVTLGRTPPPHAVERALAVLRPAAGSEVLAIDDLGVRHPEFAACAAEGSGALLLPLAPDPDDAILWFRPELAQTVTWGGNPAEHATLEPDTGHISPRSSFAAWKETVSGHSAPWAEVDLGLARELRSVFQAEVAQRTKAELARLRHYDSLTGLPNRSLLQDRLEEAGQEPGSGAVLLFLDLDRFKAINDTMGHAAGDALLVEVARRLLAAAGPETLAARLGGDEFVVLCRGLDAEAVAALGERVRQAMEAPFEIAGRTCHISASIGIATADRSGGLDLVQAADMAMYAAKQGGGNRGTVFEPSLHDRAARQFELDHELREALASDDQLELFYQPLFWVASLPKVLVGFEALLRWRHPRHGWMAPEVTITLAEKSGLILPLGKWVLTRALRQGQALQRLRPDTELQFAVNVSPSQLTQPGFCAGLAEMLRTEGFPPAVLCLEVTESILTNPAVADVLAEVRKLGVRVAIDDFGMGYSSLSLLRRLPVDVVKLDRAFLDDVEGDLLGASFVGAVIALAHTAGKSVVLEGIETQAQFDLAAAAGADVVQGFLLAAPLSTEDAAELVARTSVPRAT